MVSCFDKAKTLSECRSLCLANTNHQQKYTTPTIKCGAVPITLWGCFSAAGPVLLAMVEGKLDAAKHREILEENLAAVCDCDTDLFLRTLTDEFLQVSFYFD